jgi:dipeptidyl aminopeptidase/acylaminoacyl peptidase
MDPKLRVGQPDSEYGIAVYDVARGAVTRHIRLDPPWCGVADLYALPDGRLAIYCYTSEDVRLADVGQGKEVARTYEFLDAVGSAVSPDGRRLLTIGSSGTLYDIDLARLSVDHVTELGPGDGSGPVPFQQLNLTADGKQLFVRAAPGDAENRAAENGTVVWVVDTETRQRIATVPLPAPAFDLAPSRDGGLLVATTDNVADHRLFGTRLIEVPSGREVSYWPGLLVGTQLR